MVDSAQAPPYWDLEPVLEVWVYEDLRPTVVALAGRLDATTGDQVRALLMRLLDEGHRDVVMDLDRVRIVEHEVAAMFADIQNRAHRSGGNLVLVGPARPSRRGEDEGV